MIHRSPSTIALLTLTVSMLAFGQTAKPQTAKPFAAPRTADGHPDLEGTWTNATLTPLERPAALANKPTLTAAEAAAFEKRAIETFNIDRRGGGAEADVARAYNNLFIDRGDKLAEVDGTFRTSLIIDPPDGKVPPLTPEGRKRVAARMERLAHFDSAEDRPLGERCLMGFGSTGGPPMMPVLYNNNYQIVETPAAVMIMVEMVHDIRVIHLDRQEHLPASIREWMGDSIGHWEGDTLVVDTTNFTDKTMFRGASENLHVVERFTRTAPNTILYRFTIDDSSAFTRSWTAEYPFLAAPGPIYEYACQEGNYALQDILAGARAKDKEAEAAKKSK
ncbi:MAG TPA: hypothetical protein VK419_17755 [Bryobacteraceae bacterium]|nr:hypothetical protein [Bryobacteraceae bacterium]